MCCVSVLMLEGRWLDDGRWISVLDLFGQMIVSDVRGDEVCWGVLV